MLHLTIVSPEKTMFKGDVNRVELPGELGPFTILEHHAPIISTLVSGKITYFTDEHSEQSLDIASGFMEMSGEHVIVCVEQKHEND